MVIEPFVVDVPQTTLDDLAARLARTRWPDEIEDAGWDYGTSLAYLQVVVEYWRTRFDWRRAERTMNTLPHFHANVDGLGVHFVHASRAAGDDAEPRGRTHHLPHHDPDRRGVVDGARPADTARASRAGVGQRSGERRTPSDPGIPAILSRASCPRSSTFRPPRAWLATGTAC
jgi:Epoxide hydrolase N terminus